MREISSVGEVFIDFNPPKVAVYEHWESLWDLSKLESMTERDRIALEKRKLDILHIQFVKNSEELN